MKNEKNTKNTTEKFCKNCSKNTMRCDESRIQLLRFKIKYTKIYKKIF